MSRKRGKRKRNLFLVSLKTYGVLFDVRIIFTKSGEGQKTDSWPLEQTNAKIYYKRMLQPEKNMTNSFIEDFIEKPVLSAVQILDNEMDAKKLSEAAVTVAVAFGADKKSFSIPSAQEEKKLIASFNNNLTLLVQKTWVEKSDGELKEQILYQLNQFCEDLKTKSWAESYVPFIDIIYNAVYLMFGPQTKSDDFPEYAFRIDPEFGIFWWYIQSLPHESTWPEEKCRITVLLGMYFLANY